MLASCWLSIAGVLVLLVSAPAAAAGNLPMAIELPGCNATCGNVSVPYLFGMAPPRYYYSPGFKLTCDQYGRSKPPRLLLGDGRSDTFEVVDISLKNATMRVLSHGIHSVNMSGGSGRWSIGDTLGNGVAYFLKPYDNEFILTGCDVQATLLSNGSIVTGCASFCALKEDGFGLLYSQIGRPNSKACSNIGCCQTSIVTGSASYGVELQLLNRSLPMSAADTEDHLIIIAEVGWLDKKQFQDLVMLFRTTDARRDLRVPAILHWTVAHDAVVNNSVGLACPSADHAARSICKSTDSECSEYGYIALGGYSCQCKEDYQGNPYLTAGCQDIKECGQKERHGCFGDCEELPGSFRCRCPEH